MEREKGLGEVSSGKGKGFEGGAGWVKLRIIVGEIAGNQAGF